MRLQAVAGEIGDCGDNTMDTCINTEIWVQVYS